MPNSSEHGSYFAVSAWNLRLLEEDIPIAILAVHDPATGLIDALASQLFTDESLISVKVFILLDDTVDIFDLNTVCWLTCANIDPERDIRLAEASRQQIIIDACMKYPQSYNFPREWPNLATSSQATICTIDEKWEQLGLGNFISSPSKKYPNIHFFM